MEALFDSAGRKLVVNFKVEPSATPSGLWVIHGRQEAEVDSEA
jgi:hypothetical protein